VAPTRTSSGSALVRLATVGIAFGIIAGAVGIGVALWRGFTDYRQNGTITWGWLVVALIFLAIALTPIV
jgi:hypothetical protein